MASCAAPRVIARLLGDAPTDGSFRVNSGRVIEQRQTDGSTKKFAFDAVYGDDVSDAEVFRAEGAALVAGGGAFVAFGDDAGGLGARFLEYACGAGVDASVVEIRREAAADLAARGGPAPLGFDAATGALHPPPARVSPACEACRAPRAAGAHRAIFLGAGATACALVELDADDADRQGLAALGNALRDGDAACLRDSRLTRALRGTLGGPTTVCVFAAASADAATADRLRYAARLRRPGRAAPLVGESLKTERLRADHAAEVAALREAARAQQEAADEGLARALLEAEVGAKAAADEFERRDREAALKLREDDFVADADARSRQLEADRKLAVDLLKGDRDRRL